MEGRLKAGKRERRHPSRVSLRCTYISSACIERHLPLAWVAALLRKTQNLPRRRVSVKSCPKVQTLRVSRGNAKIRGSSISTSLGTAVSKSRRSPLSDLGRAFGMSKKKKGRKSIARRRSGSTILGMEGTMPSKRGALLRNRTR